jgi:MFS family permease
MTSSARSLLKPILIVTSGNFLEMYDFMVYGYYAQGVAKAYFPSGDAFASLMATFAAFGAGFLMRPIGAIVLGAVLDRYGRRLGLLLTLGLMAVGTLTIAFTPAYAHIGVAAPLLVVAGRLIQGLSAGVEVGGVSVYLFEIARPENRGFVASWQSASQQLAVVFAALIGVLMASALSQQDMAAWGWRIPFIIGCALIPFLLIARSQLQETSEFLRREVRPGLAEIARTIWSNGPTVLLGTMMVTLTTVAFYLITAYTPTYGSSVLHLSLTSAFVVTLCVGVSNFVILPVSGAVSDRIGRRPLLIGAALAIVLTSYPGLSWLVSSPSFMRLLIVELWLSVAYATYNGALIVYLADMMPKAVRTSAFSLAYSLATALFGGFTPLICTWLIHRTGNRAAPGYWVSGAGIVALIGILAIRDGKDGRRTGDSRHRAHQQTGTPTISDRSP